QYPKGCVAGHFVSTLTTGLNTLSGSQCWPNVRAAMMRSGLGRVQVASFKQLLVVDYIFGPKLGHDPLHNLRAQTSTGIIVAEMTEARDARQWVAGVRGKRRIGRLMNDALRSNI